MEDSSFTEQTNNISVSDISKDIDDLSDTDDLTISDKTIKDIHHITNVNNTDEYIKYYTTTKTTRPFINIYEQTKLISVRAEQISNGAKALINVPKNVTNSADIARLEYDASIIPFMIRRYIDDSYEDWRLSEFINK